MPKPFDLLQLYARYCRERDLSLTTSETLQAFLRDQAIELEGALANNALIHGQRAAAMFESLVLALGKYKLLKREDTGRIHSVERFRAADFRIVLETGEQWLVEVKNVYEQDPFAQRRRLMTPAYFSELDQYARATGAILKLAVFWARWGFWSVVTPSALLDHDGFLKLEMTEAMELNELGCLGDLLIATRSPLRLRLVPDLSKPCSVDAEGLASFVIGNAVLLSEDRVLSLPIEQQLAWIFIQFGEWDEQEPEAIYSEGTLAAVEFSWLPRHRSEEQELDFDVIGSLSRIFSRYYAARTIPQGAVVQIEVDHRPGWFSSLLCDYKGSSLPVWRFQQKPKVRGS